MIGPCATLSSNFNPRSREGSDFPLTIYACLIADFNPRSREGSDVHAGVIPFLDWISIHAPVKGATFAKSLSVRLCRHFNPRSREGSDNRTDRAAANKPDFNPRSREGSDPYMLTQETGLITFQSTLP